MCLFTIKTTTIAALVFSFLACQVLHIFGNVTVLRGSPNSLKVRSLSCITEDDGSALVWNKPNQNSERLERLPLPLLTETDINYQHINNHENINCKMIPSEKCFNLWGTKHWSFTHSSKTPMAPVFDQRWEEFEEFEEHENPSKFKYVDVGSLKTSAVALSFSARAQKDVHILLCKSKEYTKNFCYWITIGGWNNALSVIRKCPQGLNCLTNGRDTWSNISCANQLSFEHTPLSASEWRSFVITSNSATRNITVYDTDNMIMTYADKEELKKNRIIERLDYQVFIGSTDKMLFRFHHYDFLHTTTTGANLTSPILKVNGTTVCIQMFIGLCAECDAQVFLRDSTSNEVLEMVTAKGSLKPAIHGLPTWQSVIIKKNLTSTSSLVVQVIPKLSTITSNPLWAIANVRQCPPTVSWRVSSVVIKQDLVKQDNLEDFLTCQKLFYNEHTVVNAIQFAKEDVALDENCENGKLGPQCLFTCKYGMFNRIDCKENAICYKNGCTCLPGFSGSTCSNPCGPNKYGHNCKKTCGSCKKINPMSAISSVESNLCDKTTGACLKGCKVENEKLYIRPLCKTAIDASVLPVINYTSTTNIRATVPITWKDEYKKDEIKYIFYIIEKQQLNEQNCINISCYYSEWSNILPNTTYVIGNFENLKSNIEYKVRYVIRVGDLSVRSNWQEAETDCNRIDTSVALVTNYTNQTSVQVTIPMTWKDEYEEATIFYSFIIQGQFNNYYVQKSWNRIFPNTTHLIGNFADLEIGTTYLIKYGLQIEKSTVYSDWHSVETDCIPILLFDITLGETNLTINWQINENVSLRQQSCPPNWYRLEVQHNNTVVHVVNESAMHFPYEVSSLKPYTLYNVIIFRKYLKLFSQEIRTHEGVPTPVLNFRAMSQSSEQVTTINHSDNITLMWQEPSLPNGEIVRYDVTVKVKTYIGCMDMELPSPNNHIIEISTKNTTITISNFHPYAYYSVSVTAFNSHYGSTAIETIFQTNESDIPTEIFSQLILQGQILSWTIPEDCTTITGPLKAKIKIYGISDLVKNFSFTDWTKSYFYDLKHIIPQLHGAERYVAKVYVIRDWKSSENASAFQKYEFETPPAAPPQITNLDVVEIDTRHTPATIYLRWQSPLPPFNGKLDYYVIRICDMYYRTPCQNFSVQVNKSCDLWNDYICGSVKNWSTNFQIQILTYNINVTQPSVPVNVTKAMLNNTIPDTPENYTFTINNNSIVDVRWNHPWKTGSHLQNFNIWLEEISSNLTMRVFQPSVFKMQKYTVTHYMRYYNKQLYLFPSTLYHIHIQAVTVTDKVSAVNTVIVQTPTAIDFDGNVNITMQEPNSTISISIPPVVNETRNSVMHILVKGCNFCEQYSEVPEILQAEINMDKNAWMQAAEGSISKFANSTFILGNKETCGRVTNCSLKSEGLYEIAIIITEENLIIKRIMFTTSIHNFSIEVPSQYHKAYVICPIITCLVLIAVTFYFYRRRKKQTAKQCTSQDGIVLSPNIRNCVSEDCVDETTSVISTSKQIRNKSEEESNTIPIEIYENTRILSANLSTASDRQPLSLATIPEMPLIAIENDDEKKETASLVEDKELNHYEIMR